MNYIAEIKAFYGFAQDNGLSSGQIALWHGLMFVCNRSGWQEWFTVASISLQSHTGLSRQGVLKARNRLKQIGLIDFKTNGSNATAYKVNSLLVSNSVQDSIQDSIQSSIQDSIQDSIQSSIQDSIQDSIQNSSALNKQNKTKQNQTIKKEKIKKEKSVTVEIVSYLNERAGTHYRNTSDKTQAVIRARLNDGFSLTEFKTVIDKKCDDWIGTEYEKYLRPETLFGTKFESYLNGKSSGAKANSGIAEEDRDSLDDVF